MVQSLFFLIVFLLTVNILVTSHLSQFINIDSEFLDVKNAAEMEMIDSSSPHVRSRIGNVLMCFSIYTNTKMVFNTELDAEAIPVIHGLRFLSMVWIIIAHTVLYTTEYFGKCADTKKNCRIIYTFPDVSFSIHNGRRFAYVDNKIWALRFAEGIPAQVISNATISVDTYLFLSGLLLAYMYLKNKGRNKPINCGEKLKEFFVCVLRRFIR